MSVCTLTCVSQILKKHPSKNPAPLLQATVLGKLKRIVRNEMENGYTERNVKLEIYLTEPQSIIKKRKRT